MLLCAIRSNRAFKHNYTLIMCLFRIDRICVHRKGYLMPRELKNDGQCLYECTFVQLDSAYISFTIKVGPTIF